MKELYEADETRMKAKEVIAQFLSYAEANLLLEELDAAGVVIASPQEVGNEDKEKPLKRRG